MNGYTISNICAIAGSVFGVAAVGVLVYIVWTTCGAVFGLFALFLVLAFILLILADT